jgi:hypothetical protein
VFRVSGFRFRVSGFGFRVSGFGFRVSGFESGITPWTLPKEPPQIVPGYSPTW